MMNFSFAIMEYNNSSEYLVGQPDDRREEFENSSITQYHNNLRDILQDKKLRNLQAFAKFGLCKKEDVSDYCNNHR